MNNRKLLLINPRMQIKYISIIVLIFVIISLWLTWETYFFLKGLIESNNLNLNDKLTNMFIVMLVKIAILSIIFSFLGLFLSSRIAGPMYKLSQNIKYIAEHADLTVSFPLREKDELKEVAESLNSMLSMFRKKLISDDSFRNKVQITAKAMIHILNKKRKVTSEEKEKLIKAGNMLIKESLKNPIQFKV